MNTQKVYRSREDKIIGGVCGGLGEYFNIDSTIIRLAWVAITIFSAVFPGVLVYIIAMLIIPRENHIERSIQKTVIEVKGHTDERGKD